MGVDIKGWVEVRPDWLNPPEPNLPEGIDRWVGIITHVGFIVGRDYDMFDALFGTRLARQDHPSPVARERGIPRDASTEVREAVERVMQLPPDAFFGASWATWAELKSADQTLLIRDPEWKTLFDLMEVLAGRYSDQGVRLVAWFGW